MSLGRAHLLLASGLVGGCIWFDEPSEDVSRLGPVPLPSIALGPTPADTPMIAISTVAPLVLSTNSIMHVHGSGFTESAQGSVRGDGVATDFINDTHLVLTGISGPVGPAVVRITDGSVSSNEVAIEIVPAGTLAPFMTGGLEDPRGMVRDPADGALLVFDLGAGIMRVDPDARTLTRLSTGTMTLDGPVAGVFAQDGRLFVADGARILRRESDRETWTVAAMLASPATSLAIDAAGTLYWAHGTTNIGRLSAGGTLELAAATVPAASGLAFHSGRLYMTDPVGDAIHRLDPTTGDVDAGWAVAAQLEAPLALFSDGTSLFTSVSDSAQNVSIVRLGVDGSVAQTLSGRPIGGPASPALLVDEQGQVVHMFVDGSVGLRNGASWTYLAIAPARKPATGIAWVEETAYVSFCNGDGGGIVEISGGIYQRIVLSRCARRGLSVTESGSLIWASSASLVSMWDPVTGVLSEVGVPGGIGSGAYVAPAESGGFFVSRDNGVDYRSATGGLLAADVVTGQAVGLAVNGTNLYAVLSLDPGDALLRIPLDPVDGAPGSPVEMIGSQEGFLTLRHPIPRNGVVLFTSTGFLYSVSMDGETTQLLDSFGDAFVYSMAESPYGGLSVGQDGRNPSFLLP